MFNFSACHTNVSNNNWSGLTFSLRKPLSANPTKMVTHTQKTCRQKPTNCLSVFDHFVGWRLKVLSSVLAPSAFNLIPATFFKLKSVTTDLKSLANFLLLFLCWLGLLPHCWQVKWSFFITRNNDTITYKQNKREDGAKQNLEQRREKKPFIRCFKIAFN